MLFIIKRDQAYKLFENVLYFNNNGRFSCFTKHIIKYSYRDLSLEGSVKITITILKFEIYWLYLPKCRRFIYTYVCALFFIRA
jgi:hypothetical protein